MFFPLSKVGENETVRAVIQMNEWMPLQFRIKSKSWQLKRGRAYKHTRTRIYLYRPIIQFMHIIFKIYSSILNMYILHNSGFVVLIDSLFWNGNSPKVDRCTTTFVVPMKDDSWTDEAFNSLEYLIWFSDPVFYWKSNLL